MRTDSLRRELAACASILIAGALITVALAFAAMAFIHHDHVAAYQSRPDCDRNVDIVTVWGNDPTPCNVLASQRLDIVGINIADCDDMGGEWIGDGIDLCSDVDK